ncbi:hypothetical protein C8J57DRAFT_1255535 [Mycena rebaudengoi]|nr:hypothetical protein C8J57DRAFT_1255535 [Mycena rebaudengoi]
MSAQTRVQRSKQREARAGNGNIDTLRCVQKLYARRGTDDIGAPPFRWRTRNPEQSTTLPTERTKERIECRSNAFPRISPPARKDDRKEEQPIRTAHVADRKAPERRQNRTPGAMEWPTTSSGTPRAKQTLRIRRPKGETNRRDPSPRGRSTAYDADAVCTTSTEGARRRREGRNKACVLPAGEATKNVPMRRKESRPKAGGAKA